MCESTCIVVFHAGDRPTAGLAIQWWSPWWTATTTATQLCCSSKASKLSTATAASYGSGSTAAGAGDCSRAAESSSPHSGSTWTWRSRAAKATWRPDWSGWSAVSQPAEWASCWAYAADQSTCPACSVHSVSCFMGFM